ncbi:uncharacterized protein PHALS_04875 [Plasmopara halstedii]|uniref:Uncharacterized protein n=1 Tax=Plasmopara halstedii TaxID=4781 RepID=A0A0P1B1C1_PLAHL|nr:uncharacterized protein PHALS_04875 [Plasmopara halstedii]CEG47732.1 hypothetical protein PHALS_04875 [Plasmopara halstedii]|eukprot:XP_024584101.1 hypothetical protein PHALS_04875 [Plasmopara halstedii]
MSHIVYDTKSTCRYFVRHEKPEVNHSSPRDIRLHLLTSLYLRLSTAEYPAAQSSLTSRERGPSNSRPGEESLERTHEKALDIEDVVESWRS